MELACGSSERKEVSGCDWTTSLSSNREQLLIRAITLLPAALRWTAIVIAARTTGATSCTAGATHRSALAETTTTAAITIAVAVIAITIIAITSAIVAATIIIATRSTTATIAITVH